MTAQETIEMCMEIKDYLTQVNPIWDKDKVGEALNMAIEALQDAGYMKWLEDNLLEYEPVGLTCDIFGGSEECEKVCKFTCPQRECLYRAYQEEAIVMKKSNSQNQTDSELKTKTGDVSATDVIYRADAIEECKLEFLNPNVERETEKLTLIDQSFAKGWNYANSIWIKALEQLPSAEPSAQPDIVRCKDCIRFEKKRGCNLVEGLNIARVDSFCSYAERRTDG